MTDTEKFRLRHFVEKLVQQGECVIHDDPIDLIDVAAVLDCNPHAVWFRAVGSSWMTHSPCCTSFSTKWRKRNFSVSVMKMLSSRSIAYSVSGDLSGRA